MRDPVHYWFMKEIKVMWSKTWLPQWNFSLHIKSVLQLYGVAQHDTVHLYHVTSYFLLYPLLYGVALSDSVFMSSCLSLYCQMVFLSTLSCKAAYFFGASREWFVSIFWYVWLYHSKSWYSLHIFPTYENLVAPWNQCVDSNGTI